MAVVKASEKKSNWFKQIKAIFKIQEYQEYLQFSWSFSHGGRMPTMTSGFNHVKENNIKGTLVSKAKYS